MQEKTHLWGNGSIYSVLNIIYIHYINISMLDTELEVMLGYFLVRQCPKQGPEQSFVQKVCSSRGFLNIVVKQAGECCLIPLKALILQEKKKILQGPIIWLATQGWHWILGDIMKRPSFCSKQIGTAVMIIAIIMSIINKWQCILLALGDWASWQAACCTLSHNNDIHCQPRKFT